MINDGNGSRLSCMEFPQPGRNMEAEEKRRRVLKPKCKNTKIKNR